MGDPGAPRAARKGLSWRALLRLKWRHDDKESALCYVLFMALFVADFSVLAMAFPVVLYIYALLAQTPATRFWQARTLSRPSCCQSGMPAMFGNTHTVADQQRPAEAKRRFDFLQSIRFKMHHTA